MSDSQPTNINNNTSTTAIIPTILSANSNTILTFNSDFDASQSLSSQSSRQSLIQNHLKEIHYIPYNTSNSLTIYSYSLWKNHVLVSTKENYLKKIYYLRL